MNILLNAQPHKITAQNLQDALAELGFDSAGVATALNGAFVARNSRAATPLTEGDRIEVLSPMQGG